MIRAIYRDNRRYAVQPKVVRRTISADTAATLTTIMEGVVGDKHGTATRAQIPGYTIAGKTGTAAKLIGGRYSTSDYNASFVGFVPSRDPVGRDHRRHRLAARVAEYRGLRVGAGVQADRGGDAALSRRRAVNQSAAAGPGGAATTRDGADGRAGGLGAGRQPRR